MPSLSQSDFSDGIVMWVKKKTGPEIDFVKLEYDAEELLLQVDTPFAVAVATLALGLRPRQRGCKGAGQREARESHQRLPGV
jgi:hypothetical protein